MAFWKRRSDNSDIEARLRAERPEPSDELVSRLAADTELGAPTPRHQREPRARLGLGLASTGAIAAGVVVLFGAGPSGPSSASVDPAQSSTPAQNQYQEKVTICHRSKKGEKGNTLTLPAPAAQAHLEQHPHDTAGPCPSGNVQGQQESGGDTGGGSGGDGGGVAGAQESGGNAGTATGTSSGSGQLPFTGIALLVLGGLGLASLLSGVVLRRHAA